MKKIIFSLLCVTMAMSIFAQNEANITYNPKVDWPYPASQYGTTQVSEVNVVDGNTFVAIKYHTSSASGAWIMLSSDTYLIANGKKYPIQAWGVETNEISSLDFNTQYTVNPNTTYNLVLAFPQIPVGAENISVVEPDGFYWKGIHINNSKPISRSASNGNVPKGNTTYNGPGKELVGTTFRVTNNTTNGENNDQASLSQDHAIHFYITDDGEFSFSNHWRKPNSQSYGPIYSMNVTQMQETSTSYPATEYKFTWNYNNSYDSNHGSAMVTFTIIYVQDVVKFVCKVVVMETNMILEYKGYLE